MKTIIFSVAFLIFGFLIGYFLLKSSSQNIKEIENCESKYSFINPQLGCGQTLIIKKHGYSDLVEKLNAYIETNKNDGVVENVSVYFRDLENGPAFGINENERFIPASLFKLPIMFAYYQLVDEEGLDLGIQIGFGQDSESQPSRQFFPPKEEVKPHTPYTLDDLIYRMIAYSDNKATAALVSDLGNRSTGRGSDLMLEIYKSTGITYPDDKTDAVITTKSYASLFRILYNASFLSSEMSEKALKNLASGTFKQGIPKGVPENILTAHKFGERFDESLENDVEQFHDCGIVYFPNNPYLLCIMTKGKYIPTLVASVANISEMVYKEVESRKIEN